MLNFFSIKIHRWQLVLLAGDIVAFCLSTLFGILMIRWSWWIFLGQNAGALFLVLLTYILVLYVANLYDFHQDFRNYESLGQVILAPLTGTLLALILFATPYRRILHHSFIEWQGVALVWLLVSWRYLFSALALPTRLRRRVLIIGAGQSGQSILRAIQKRQSSGLVVTGFVDDNPQKIGSSIDEVPVLGDTSRIPELIDTQAIGLIIVAITHVQSPALVNQLTRLSYTGLPVVDMPTMFEFLTGKIPTDHISDLWLFFHNLSKGKLYYRRIKRIVDLGIALLGVAMTWPLWILTAMAIRLDSPGPIIFRQERLGQYGKPFQILKFRTMSANAKNGKPQWTTADDSRITRVGRLIRKMHLDELPQLINIIKGEMSLVGPRAEWDIFALKSQELVPEWRPGRRASDPPDLRILSGYRQQVSFYSYRLLVKPGVSGWAQVMFPRASSSPEDLKEKLQYDLYYINNMGLLLDLAIILKTVNIVLLGRGK